MRSAQQLRVKKICPVTRLDLVSPTEIRGGDVVETVIISPNDSKERVSNLGRQGRDAPAQELLECPCVDPWRFTNEGLELAAEEKFCWEKVSRQSWLR